MYADCDDVNYARHLFDELPQPNVFAWTALNRRVHNHSKEETIVIAAVSFHPKEVLQTFEVLPCWFLHYSLVYILQYVYQP
nr:pentatricopeptide repeat-containing protein DOT4, chloroplastic-like [Ipomoea batatas]